MVLGALHLMKERILSCCLEEQSEGGVDGADARVVGFFLCMCFKLDALALVVEWSFRATFLVAITSKPLKPNHGPTLVSEKSTVHVGGEVRGGT